MFLKLGSADPWCTTEISRQWASLLRSCSVSPLCGHHQVVMESGLCSSPRPGLASRSPLSMLFLRCCRVPPSHFLFGRPPTSSPCRGPSPSPTPPLFCTRFGTASFGMSRLCFWQELAVAVLRDGAVLPWQLVGRWNQVTCRTPETGQCGEDQRLKAPVPLEVPRVAVPVGVGRGPYGGWGSSSGPPAMPSASVLSVWQLDQVLWDPGHGPPALPPQTAELTLG